jgi:methionine synthase II (cobalamin-independent)
VIAAREGCGVEVVTDGEMRRFLFIGPITETSERGRR